MKRTKQDSPEPGLMTIKEVAQYLKVNIYTVYKMAEHGELPAAKLGRIWRFRKDEIYRWLAEKMTREKKARLARWQKKIDRLMKERP